MLYPKFIVQTPSHICSYYKCLMSIFIICSMLWRFDVGFYGYVALYAHHLRRFTLSYSKVYALCLRFNPHGRFDLCHRLRIQSTCYKVDMVLLHLYLTLSTTFTCQYELSIVAPYALDTYDSFMVWLYVD